MSDKDEDVFGLTFPAKTDGISDCAMEPLRQAMERVGGTDRDVIKMITDERVMRRVLAAVWDEAAPCPPDHYRVRVEHDPVPEISELRKRFSRVSDAYDGQPWRDGYADGLGTYPEIVRTPCDRDFFLYKSGRARAGSREVIDWADENGYRQATLVEALAFAVAHPEFPSSGPMVALGSFVPYCGASRVPVLDRNGIRCDLRINSFGSDWNGACCFLLVRL